MSGNDDSAKNIGAGVTDAGGAAEPVNEQDTEEVEFTDTDDAKGSAAGKETEEDAGDGAGNEAKPGDGDKYKTRDRKRDAEEARQRREREKQAAIDKARTEAATEGIIEALGGKNPYTGDELKDAADVEVWRRMKRIEARGGDPVREYASEAASDERKRAGEEADKKAREDAAAKDWKQFTDANPGVTWDALTADEGFMAYADGKLGKKPLSEIYAGYRSLVGRYTKQAAEAEDTAVQRAAQAIANGMASPGSATGESGEVENDYLTEEQVAAMTPRQVAENYDRVWKSQQRWKKKG